MNTTDTPLITVPLGGEAHRLARQFAAETLQLAPSQIRREAGKRVYINTLAVYAVHSYLKWLGYETDLSQGNSWHPLLRSRWDVADLVIPKIGKLECRPVWEGETAFTLPSEATEDRIGYVVVQFGEELNQASLRGFAPPVDASLLSAQLLLADLQSLDALIDYLYRLEIANEFFRSGDPVAVRVMQVLETSSISEIITQLERIYQSEPEDERPYFVKDVLAGGMTANATSRESIDEDEIEVELLELAESLVEKLGEIWEDAA